MSIARIKVVNKAAKDQGECEKCKTPLPVGSAYRWFKVGFRSRYKHRRCMANACTPRTSELESSNLSQVYAAQEDFEDGLDDAASIEDFRSLIEEYAGQVSQIADEYRTASEDPNGNVFNTVAEERADALEALASDIEGYDLESGDIDLDDLDGDDPKRECEACSSGKIECPACFGSGEDGEDTDETDAACVPCEGTGQVDCEECEGEGEVSIPQEEIDEAINALRDSARGVLDLDMGV